MSSDYVSVKKAAKRTGISERTLRDWCQRGEIPGANKPGTEWIIPERWVQKQEQEKQRRR